MKRTISKLISLAILTISLSSCNWVPAFTYLYSAGIFWGLVNNTQQDLTIETITIDKIYQSNTYYKVSKYEVLKGDSCHFYVQMLANGSNWDRAKIENVHAIILSETDPDNPMYRSAPDGCNKILCEKCIKISIYDVDGNLLREWTPANNNGRSPFNAIGKEWGLYWEREILEGETLSFDKNYNPNVSISLVYPITEEDITPAEE